MRSTMSHGTFLKNFINIRYLRRAIIYMTNLTFWVVHISELSECRFHAGQIDILCAFPLCPMPLSLAL